MHAFAEENIPLAIPIYLFISNVLWFVSVEMCITVTVSPLSFTKMTQSYALEEERQMYVLTHVSKS